MVSMRERAENIGARLKVQSRVTAGTEIELSVPNHIAFQHHSSQRPLGWLARIYPGKTRAGHCKEARELNGQPSPHPSLQCR